MFGHRAVGVAFDNEVDVTLFVCLGNDVSECIERHVGVAGND